MALRMQAQDGSIQTFPDGTSSAAVQLAMTAYDNRDSWGGLAKKVGSAINQTEYSEPALSGSMMSSWRKNPQAAYLDSLGLLPSDVSSQQNPFTSTAAPTLPRPTPTFPSAAPTQGSVFAASPQGIDEYLKSKGSPMARQGQMLYNLGVAEHLDPRFLIAISGAETGFGKNVTWGR
ncbi:MAG TPA: hypothetical protein VL358_04190 [Caulobacteraceae bacterium]|nr:hypothetical protein [Caulobacteraceae bacterium]